jgi:DNA ligase (NAD+)
VNPIKTIIEQKARYKKARVAYEAGSPIMSDTQFDKLEDQIRKLDPKWVGLKKTGTTIKSKKAKTKLPRPMPSLNKVYPEQSNKWVGTRKSAFAMDKLDGSALLLFCDRGAPHTLITRGNGTVGGNISFLLPWLNLPARIKDKGTIYLRCEAVMKDKVFDKYYASKYDNPRNLVAGILNRSMTGEPTAEEKLALKRTDIIVLGIFDAKLATSLPKAKSLGFNTVFHYDLKNPTPERLTAYLNARRKASPYAIDGIVIADMNFVMDYENADKPKDIVAFKVNADEDAVEAKVKRIIYQVTGHSRIIPKVEIEPTRIGGVTVKHATVHNAAWMLERKIGPGATIKIVRSGGVIPKIVGVVKAGKIQLPDIAHELKAKHFVVKAATAETKDRVKVLNIHKFMTTIGIEFLGESTITDALPNFPTVVSYLEAWHRRKLVGALVTSGFGERTARKIDAEFSRVFQGKKVPLKKLMVASRCYPVGIGERKLSQLERDGVSMDRVTNMIARKKPGSLATEISEVHGFDEKTADAVVAGTIKFMPRLAAYRKFILIDGSIPTVKKVVNGKLSGQFVAWTGYRSEEEATAVLRAGGVVVSFGSTTTILLYKDGGKESSKIDKARAKGIKVCTFKELKL